MKKILAVRQPFTADNFKLYTFRRKQIRKVFFITGGSAEISVPSSFLQFYYKFNVEFIQCAVL